MLLPDPMNENTYLNTRIQSWIAGITPGTPEASHRVDKRKHCGQHDNITNPSKLQASPTSRRRALAPTSGNTMQQPSDRSSPTRRSPRRPNPPNLQHTTPRHGANERAQTLGDEQEERTPRPSKHGFAETPPKLSPRKSTQLPVRPPPYNGPASVQGGGFEEIPSNPENVRSSSQSSDSDDNWVRSLSGSLRTDSQSDHTRGGTSSTRSRSPVKTMADLRMAERATEPVGLDGYSASKAGGILKHYCDLRSISLGEGVIPKSLKEVVEQHLHEHDYPPERFYTTGTASEYDRIIGEKVLRIYESAQKCDKEHSPEGHWNTEVHAKLLKLVIKNPKYNGSVGYENVQRARISPIDLAMVHAGGLKMDGKIVDYALVIKPNKALEKRIKNTLKDLPKISQSVNQTNHPPVRWTPIILNIETKLPWTGGETADIQHSVWGGAGITKLDQMLATNRSSKQQIPTIPVVTFYGHCLMLSALRKGDEENHLIGKMVMGSTETIEGTFQIVKALDYLVNWGNTTYREWYFQHAIKA